MRKSSTVGLLLALVVVFATVAEPVFALEQRGGSQRGGGGVRRGGGRGPEPLSDDEIANDFDQIVDLICTDQEGDDWADLRGDEEKQAFITAFWERRDPTPGTPDNEYRDIWMQRVNYANARFTGEGNPGYETDRGKFYIIYGPEALVSERREQADGGGGGAAVRGRATLKWGVDWTQNPFLDRKEEVSFAQQQRSYSRSTDGIELTEDAFLAGVAVNAYFDARRVDPTVAGPSAGGPTTPAADPGTPLGVPPTPAADPGTLAATSSAHVLALRELMAGTTRQDLTLKQDMAYVPAQQGNTFAIFNFEVGKPGLTFASAGVPRPAALRAFGVLYRKDRGQPNGERSTREIAGIDFNVPADDGDADEISTHSFGMTLVPGGYRLAWGVMDIGSERIVTASYEFDVPNFTVGSATELSILSVLIANGIERHTDAIDANTVYKGTRVGNLSLGTDLDNLVGRNDLIDVLYFIQGASIDPATQQTQLEVDHRVLTETSESIARLPTQTLASYAVQQEIPLAQIEQIEPGQNYKIQIHVKDLISGHEVTHEVPISIRGG